MKALAWFAACVLLSGMPVARSQQVLATSSSAPPPPGSVVPSPDTNRSRSGTRSLPLPSTGIPPSVAPAARQEDGNGDSTNVAIHTDASGDTIEEYSRNGKVYMIRVTPTHGVTQTYLYNSPDGSLMHDRRLGPVAPVYYDIYQWGGPRKPASSAPVAASTSGQ
ncbi:MAG: DUF2782 domain-containing protein [Rhodanobacteraceae bacterium]